MSKIFLQYAWIKEYRGIKDIEINFSDKFTISYDKMKRLTLSAGSPLYIDDFFESNIDINAIVGKNGSGKTSIIHFLFDLFNNHIDSEFIIVFYEYDKDQFDIYYSDILSMCFEGFAIFDKYLGKTINNFHSEKLHKSTSGVYEFVSKNNNFEREQLLFSEKTNEKIKVIYYSEVYDYSHYGDYNDKIYNISPAYMLSKYTQYLHSSIGNGDPYTLLQNEIVQEQLFFLKDNFEDIKEFGIDFSHDCFLYVKASNTFKEFVNSFKKSVIKAEEGKSESKNKSDYYDNCIKLEKEINVDLLFDNFFSFKCESNTDKFIKSILKATLSNFIEEFRECYVLLFNPSHDKEIGFAFIRLIQSAIDNSSVDTVFDMIKRMKSFFNDFEVLKTKYKIGKMISPKSDLLNTDNYLAFTVFLEKYLNKEELSSLVIDSNNIKLKIINDTDSDVITALNFYNYYSKINSFSNFLFFDYGLSSGEMALLNMYSRLYYVIKQRIKKSENILIENILIFIDEVDMLLHPEWQRKYIKSVLAFFKKTFPDIYFQIVIATHSPIMLSDIPKQNVLFLKKEDDGIIKDNGCNTFASNIFQLFREGFFIGDTGIGVYAEQKLKEIVDHIHNKDKDDNEINKLIAAVGDTFLRNKLNEEYLLYRSQKNDTEKIQAERIAKLESANTELLKQQRLDHEEKANHKKEAEKILKKLDDLNYNGDNTMEVTETKKKPMDDLADVIREFMQRFID